MRFLISLLLVAIVSGVQADDHLNISGMEGLQCKFAAGKDMDDVMKVIGEWNAYGDDNFSSPYSAWILTPLYRSDSDYDFDFMFLGFAQSLEAIGSAQDEFLAGANEIYAKWEAATDCSGQAMNFNAQVRAPAEDFEEGGVSITSIQSCSMNEDVSNEELWENDKVWQSYLDASKFQGGVWRWWPETGSSASIEHDYWLVASFSSVQEYGRARDNRLKSMLAGSRPAEVHSCDTPRLYQSTNIRLRQPS